MVKSNNVCLEREIKKTVSIETELPLDCISIFDDMVLLKKFRSTVSHLMKYPITLKAIISNAESCVFVTDRYFRDGNYMFKVNNRNTRKRYEICPKLTNKDTRTTPLA